MLELLTPRLRLRSWTDADRDPFAALALHPDITRYLTAVRDRETANAWIDRQIAREAEDGICFWAVEDRQSGALVGSVGLSRLRYEAHFTPAVELGWRIARPCWGAGYAPEAAAASLHHGFTTLPVPEIVAVTVPANTNSQAVMTKIGMTRDAGGDFDHPQIPDGHELKRHVLFRLGRDTWATRQVVQPAHAVQNGAGARP